MEPARHQAITCFLIALDCPVCVTAAVHRSERAGVQSELFVNNVPRQDMPSLPAWMSWPGFDGGNDLSNVRSPKHKAGETVVRLFLPGFSVGGNITFYNHCYSDLSITSSQFPNNFLRN